MVRRFYLLICNVCKTELEYEAPNPSFLRPAGRKEGWSFGYDRNSEAIDICAKCPVPAGFRPATFADDADTAPTHS